jgi:branched-chain amino acid transport system permease protein
MPEFFQFLVSGLTVGAVYALVALGSRWSTTHPML